MKTVIDQFLERAVTEGASDVHITANSPPIFRVNGELQTFGTIPLTGEETEAMAKSLVSEKDWQRFLKVGELDGSYYLQGVARFRLNFYFQKQHISFVARIIPTKIPTIEELHMPPVLKTLAKKPQGLMLVTGPTGSGKTTTLAAMIDYINRHASKHIITLEDPIEYVHEHKQSIIHQREIGMDTETFANGLRASLRQDPDIILVGEMRDLETISTAITAAETGHLVLATLHTNSAAQTIHRIIDVFPPYQQAQIRIQLAELLAGILSQRLIRTADKKGRIAATEMLVNTPSIANLIRNDRVDQIQNVLQTSRALGMHTLEMSMREWLQRGKISPEHAKPYLERAGE